MKKFILVFYICTAVMQLQGMQQIVNIGGQSGWETVSVMKGVSLSSGSKAYPDMVLQSSRYHVDKNTDLLMHFDTRIDDAANRYKTKSGTVRISHRYTAMGTGSGVFTNDGQGIQLVPKKDSYFAPGNTGDSFSMEFWLNPAYAADNEEIISFRSSRKNRKNEIVPQEVTCYIEGRRLKWTFKNFFFDPVHFTSSVTLKGEDTIIPEEWHHHMLVFHSSNGLLEYYMDNKLEGITYATASGTDDNAPLVPLIGAIIQGKFLLGKNFTGFMDELRIEKKIVDKPVLSEFQNSSGSFTTKLIDMGRGGSKLEKIHVDADIPDNSTILSYYRVYSDFRQTLQSAPPWEPFRPGTFITKMNTGRFFEIRLKMYANGSGTLSPEIHSIQTVYDKNLPPLAPLSVKAVPGNGSITLYWKNIGEADIQGYLIYYGTKSGVYFGADAQEGTSPISVSGVTYTLHGLTNGTLYYFAVAAFDKAGVSYPGAFSKEISIRPGIN